MFVPGRPFQPYMIFAGNAGAYLSETLFIMKAPGLTHKHKTILEGPARNKHFSLLQTFVNYNPKEFYNFVPYS